MGNFRMIMDILLLSACSIVTLQISMDTRVAAPDLARKYLPQLCPEINTWNGNKTSGEYSVRELESCCTRKWYLSFQLSDCE